MRTRITALVVVILLVGSACASTGSGVPVPEMTPELSTQLQARAFMRACQESACAGAPILAPDSTPPAVREAIVERFTDEVEYVSESQLEQLYDSTGRYRDGSIMLSVTPVATTERGDVVGVDVWISQGQFEFIGRTYLFLWDGSQWVDTAPDTVDVTVTTSVS